MEIEAIQPSALRAALVMGDAVDVSAGRDLELRSVRSRPYDSAVEPTFDLDLIMRRMVLAELVEPTGDDEGCADGETQTQVVAQPTRVERSVWDYRA